MKLGSRWDSSGSALLHTAVHTATLGTETSRAGGGDADDATDAFEDRQCARVRACLLAWGAKGKGREGNTRLVRA